MDRLKYMINLDYREGYDEGVENGRRQMEMQFEYVRDAIIKILSTFQNIESEDDNADNRS